MMPAIFERFKKMPVRVDDEFCSNWIGAVTARRFFDQQNRDECCPLFNSVALENIAAGGVLPNEELPEWIDVLESCEAARGLFCMIEVGAGWGRWLVHAEMALRQCHPSIMRCLVGVEPEPGHFGFMAEHLSRNGIAESNRMLIEAALCGYDGNVNFSQGNPGGWYGQSLGGGSIVDALRLDTLLARLPLVDLLDMDVQGAEAVVLSESAYALDSRIKRVHIGTHSPSIEAQLRDLFRELDWEPVHDYAMGGLRQTDWGQIGFEDGCQGWKNRRVLGP